ncbi:MAG: bifunctional demethylmenaquinone methyltransferase/2-methoxy-6-polyprenyl-1,4-benzoquinol methylase UbiE [Melioribacteraceae bacterium]|nr:bifunctional demethylmenaquinone methyltransferase/2-methoxy-6-polyprenyl-1,4-benzoquinol methylase UbiE [Melioribacteraceae bacterium]
MDKKTQVRKMFDSISYRYDLLNHLLSAGIDIYWRKQALSITKPEKNSILLDIACGTGDFANTSKKIGVEKIIGADLSFNMLKIFSEKLDWSKGNLTQMAAEQLPFKNDLFTNITVAFGVRNFYNIPNAFNEFNRVLKSKGKVTILEFKLPSNILVRKVYQLYFKYMLPLIGKIISKDKSAYQYLPDSVEEFDKKVNLKEILSRCGFSKIEIKQLTFGIVQVVVAQK